MSLFPPRDGAMWICTAFGRKVLFALLWTSLSPNFSFCHLHVNVHQMKCPNAFANHITCFDKKLFGFSFCPIIMESFLFWLTVSAEFGVWTLCILCHKLWKRRQLVATIIFSVVKKRWFCHKLWKRRQLET